MNVVHVISSGGMYGAETMLLRCAAAQRKLGANAVIADVCAPGRQSSELGRAARRQQLPVIPCTMRDGFDPRGARRLFATLRERGCDVIHSHGYKMNVHVAMWSPALRWACPVATVHGWTSVAAWGKAALYQRLDAWALRAFNHVVFVSPAMRARPQLAPLKRVSVVENGIDFTSSAPRSADTLRPGSTRLLVVGRLSAEKGLDLLLRATAQLHARGAVSRLTIAGEGPCRAPLVHLAESLGISGIVEFTGFVGDVDSLYASHDVLVLSSLTEGLPMTLLEAMRARIPVVATRVGGMPDVLDDGAAGMLVDAGNWQALSDGIAAVIEEPARARARAELGFERARLRFGAESMARGYLDVYAALLSAARLGHEIVSG
jgi:glycosyltransferase involved in cell wall biosynthesis